MQRCSVPVTHIGTATPSYTGRTTPSCTSIILLPAVQVSYYSQLCKYRTTPSCTSTILLPAVQVSCKLSYVSKGLANDNRPTHHFFHVTRRWGHRCPQLIMEVENLVPFCWGDSGLNGHHTATKCDHKRYQGSN